MNIRKTILFLFTIVLCVPVFSQPAERRISRDEYIDKFKDDAIMEMHQSGVPASITLAQGILESGDGNSPLAVYANNHFGIKCHTTWKGETFLLDDDEKNECFRKYPSVYDSYKDHSDFLTSRSRYAFLFELKITDYKGWAKGLKEAGYATHPKYAELLIDLIEKHELYQYDLHAKVEKKQLVKKKSTVSLAQGNSSRVVKLRNNIKYTFVSEGDDVASIASDFDMNVWQINKYNDLDKSDKLIVGEIIYLQPKRNKAVEDFHTVKSGETMRKISQLYGIKLRKLYKKNNMTIGSQPQTGVKLSLRKKINNSIE